jgi:hypothetical protein
LAIFARGLLITTTRKGKANAKKYHIQMLVHWLLFSGVSYCDNRGRVFMIDYDTKEKEHQNTRRSDSYSWAMPPRTIQIDMDFDVLSLLNQ